MPERPHTWNTFAVSPNGKLLAGSIRDAGGKSSDVWSYDFDRRTMLRMTFDGSNFSPVWSSDGRWLAYGSHGDGKYGIYRVAADKSGQPELLSATEFEAKPSSWTPDGKTLFYTLLRPLKAEIWTLQVSGSGETKARQFSHSSTAEEVSASVSPDGTLVAYAAYKSARWTVYVVRFSGSGGKYQVSTQGGVDPVWSRTGRELFYKDYNNQVMAVDVPAGPVFRPGNPQPLFKVSNFGSAYAVTPDAIRLLLARAPERPEDNTFITVTNWFDDLLRRAPLKH